LFAGDLFFASGVAAVLTGLVVGPFRWRHPRSSGAASAALFHFFLVLLLSWAGGAWLDRFGPAPGEVRWLAFAMVGAAAAPGVPLVTAAFLGRRRILDQPRPVEALFGPPYWTIAVATAVLIVAAYAE
jgi:hypothetical protein